MEKAKFSSFFVLAIFSKNSVISEGKIKKQMDECLKQFAFSIQPKKQTRPKSY